MTHKDIIRICTSHSVEVKKKDDTIYIMDSWCKEGISYSKWIKAPKDIRGLKNFLGY